MIIGRKGESREQLMQWMSTVQGIEPQELELLYNAGFTDRKLLLSADIVDLAAVPGIGFIRGKQIKRGLVGYLSQHREEYKDLQVREEPIAPTPEAPVPEASAPEVQAQGQVTEVVAEASDAAPEVKVGEPEGFTEPKGEEKAPSQVSKLIKSPFGFLKRGMRAGEGEQKDDTKE